jgi:HK97 gp10 family phage protein
MKPDLKLIGTEKLLSNVRKVKKQTPIAAERSVLTACEFFRGYVVKNKLSGQVLKRRTNELAGSLTSKVKKGRKEVVGQVGTKVKYAAIHEFGGEIRPVRAKALFVPLREGVEPGQSDLVFGVDFILTQLVKMPKRPYMQPSIPETAPMLRRILGEKFFMEIKDAL